MISIPAYYDGNTVRTLDTFPFAKNQKLIITVLDGAFSEHELQQQDQKEDVLYRLSLRQKRSSWLHGSSFRAEYVLCFAKKFFRF